MRSPMVGGVTHRQILPPVWSQGRILWVTVTWSLMLNTFSSHLFPLMLSVSPLCHLDETNFPPCRGSIGVPYPVKLPPLPLSGRMNFWSTITSWTVASGFWPLIAMVCTIPPQGCVISVTMASPLSSIYTSRKLNIGSFVTLLMQYVNTQLPLCMLIYVIWGVILLHILLQDGMGKVAKVCYLYRCPSLSLQCQEPHPHTPDPFAPSLLWPIRIEQPPYQKQLG